MSGGHQQVHEMGLSGAQLNRVLNNEAVRERLLRPRNIILSFDMPYVGGYSTDGKNIYLDRHLPEELKLQLDGQIKIVRPATFLAEPMGHEPVEWSVMEGLGWAYGHAHSGPATGSERRKVLQLLGPGWWQPWQNEIEKYVKADEHEKLEKLPKDLDLRPYYYPPINHKLLDHMLSIIDKGKRSKVSVNYTDKGPKETQCRACEHFIKPCGCEGVAGRISPAGWCRRWEADHGEAGQPLIAAPHFYSG